MAKKRASEGFRKPRKQKTKTSEGFGSIPKFSEKTPDHTLSVREAAKMFENAGVPRTERTILSWCQPNKQGITKLNCYFDPADRKWFLTPSSVDMAIKEEQNRLQNKGETQPSEVDQDSSEGLGSASEGFGSEQNSFGRLRKDSEPGFSDEFPQDLKSAQAVIRDLEITNKAKDYFIELLQEREKEHLSDLNKLSHEVGVLETKLKQLGAPKDHQRVIVQEEDDSEVNKNEVTEGAAQTQRSENKSEPDFTNSEQTRDEQEPAEQRETEKTADENIDKQSL